MISFHIILLWLSILKYCECLFFHLQVQDIGLEKRILAVPRSHPAAKSRFIYSRGKLHELPTGIMSLIKRQPLFSKSLLPLILREPFVRRKQDDVDESVYEFFKRRMSVEVNVEMSKGFGSFNLSGKLPTYPSPKPTLILTSHLKGTSTLTTE